MKILSVIGENYLEILHDVVVPQFTTKANFDEQYFQQNGAHPHYPQTVGKCLHHAFPQHWIGRRISIPWPPCSPLSPDTNGFLFGGAVKNKVYERNPHTGNELKDYISDAFSEIDGDRNLCCTVCQCYEQI